MGRSSIGASADYRFDYGPPTVDPDYELPINEPLAVYENVDRVENDMNTRLKQLFNNF